MNIRLFPLLALAGVAGCAAMNMSKFQEPTVELRTVIVRGIGLTGGTLDLNLEVTNPNSVDIKGTKLTLGLDIEGTHFGDVELNDAFNLPKGQPTTVIIPLTFNWAGVGAAARSALSYGTVKYDMKGTASLQTPWGVERVPFSRSGSVALDQNQTVGKLDGQQPVERGTHSESHHSPAPVERAILVAAPRKGSSDVAHLEEHLEELGRLVDTAGAEVVGTLSQQVASPNPATLIGEGKVQELLERIAASGATLAIFDEELSPVQGANLEKELKVRVMDRAEVILDIFSTRARSHEAKLQVELAQLEYMLPRLTRMWTHLSRIRGGIGLRGPGETQLETDRRMIRQKISLLRSKLQDVERHRETIRAGRQPLLSVALVGYTNAGKSSILRALSPSSEVFVEDRLFATLDTLTREIDAGEGTRVRVTDTVGFIRKLPHHLVASFRATLEEVREGDVLIHVVDVSHPEWEEQMDVVTEVLAELGVGEQEIIPVFNKIDAVGDPQAVEERVRGLFTNAVVASAIRPDGLDELKSRLRELARRERPTVAVRVPIGDGARLAEIYRLGEVVSREQLNGVFELRVRMDPAEVSRLRNLGVEVR